MIVDAADLPEALRETAASAGRQRIVAVARGGVHRARALAARFPFLDVRVVALDDEAIARALAGCVPPGCDGVVVPGEPRLARLLADRTGCRWSSGSSAYLRRRDVRRPWVMASPIIAAAPVRALAASRAGPSHAASAPGSAAAAVPVSLLQPLLARMERDLEPAYGMEDGPETTVQPEAGWAGRSCPDLRTAQRTQRMLVADGVIVQRCGRLLRVPLGLDPGGGCPPPPPTPEPATATILLHAPAEAAPAALLRRITAAMGEGARAVVVVPLGRFRDPDDMAEDLRRIARRCPFLDVHLAEAIPADERAALLAPLLSCQVRLCGADRGGLAEIAEHLDILGIDADPACAGMPWDADDWSDPASDEVIAGRCAAALADRSLMPEPWQEVAQAMAQGEAHHGGSAGEAVATTALGIGPVGRAATAVEAADADLETAPISPVAALQVEPVAAAEACARPALLGRVLDDLARGLGLLTGLPVEHSPVAGWIGLRVPDPAFMMRAMAVQGVLTRRRGGVLWLPAGPAFAPRREIRSILAAAATAIAAYGELRSGQPASQR